MSTNEEYYANYGGLTVKEYVDKYIRSCKTEMDRISETIDLLPQHIETVLDIGAGHGIFLEELKKKRGIQGVGIEITKEKIQYAQSIGINMLKGDVSKLNFPDNSFDILVACELIEHLPYGVYESALSEIMRVARKYVLITVPFREKRAFVQCPYCSSKFNPSCHFRTFDENNITTLFGNATLEKFELIGEAIQYPFEDFRRVLWPSNWSSFLVCPACGYKNDSNFKKNQDIQQLRKSQKAKYAAKKILGRKKPLWLSGLYSVR